jgi:hypothetical protein
VFECVKKLEDTLDLVIECVKKSEGTFDGEVAFLKDGRCKWKPRRTGVWGKA